MGNKSIYEILIENAPIGIVVLGFGLFLFLVGALGRWPNSQVPKIEWGWQITVVIMGIVVSGSGVFLLLKKPPVPQLSMTETSPADKDRTKIEGKYNDQKDPTEEIAISYLSENLYRLKQDHWEGVGLLDGKCYYGIYIYNDTTAHPEYRGNWGAQRGKLSKKTLELLDKPLGNKWEHIEYEYILNKADDV